MIKQRFQDGQGVGGQAPKSAIRSVGERGRAVLQQDGAALQFRVEELVQFTLRLAKGERGGEIPHRKDILQEIKGLLAERRSELEILFVKNPLVELFWKSPGSGNLLEVSTVCKADEALETCERFIEKQREEERVMRGIRQKKVEKRNEEATIDVAPRVSQRHDRGCVCFRCSY